MEELYKFNLYLPYAYKEEDEVNYIQTLFRAFELSYTNGLYQFAYIQLHMIFMVFVYFSLMKLNVLMPDKIRESLFYMLKGSERVNQFYGNSNTKNGQIYFGSFATLGESDVFLLFKMIGMDSNLQGELTKLVTERNKYAHANGNLVITSQETIDDKVVTYIRLMDRVSQLMKPQVENLYFNVITIPEFYDPELRETSYNETEHIVENLIKANYFSQQDINYCRKIQPQNAPPLEAGQIKSIHIELCNYYKSIATEQFDE